MCPELGGLWASQALTASATKAAKDEMRCEHMHETLLPGCSAGAVAMRWIGMRRDEEQIRRERENKADECIVLV